MVNVTITIPDDKVDELKLGLLVKYPKSPMDTDIEWFKQILKELILDAYSEGKKMNAMQTVNIDTIEIS
jgi:hypothetical protein